MSKYHPLLTEKYPPIYLERYIRPEWYERMEKKRKDALVGEVFLVKRDIRCEKKSTMCWNNCLTCPGEKVVWDYTITRTEDGWLRKVNVYPDIDPFSYEKLNIDDWLNEEIPLHRMCFQNWYSIYYHKTDYPESMTEDIKKFIFYGTKPEYYIDINSRISSELIKNYYNK